MPENKSLNTFWKIFFHDYMDSSWKKESYELLGTIDNIVDFWTIISVLKDKLSYGMFFFMREQTFPKWDEENIEYNFLTIKVLKSNLVQYAEDILIKLLTETLIKENNEIIKGISLSPKKNFCIIKIWIQSTDPYYENKELFNIPESYYGDILFKKCS